MAQFSSAPALSPRFSQALAKAFEWHCYGAKGFQVRKDGSAYIAHPIAVSTLVLENGGSEDEAIAALLHDVIEDVKISPEEIASHFGQVVADVVVELSEPKEGEWRDRKEAYINQIRCGSHSAVLVSLADKTHNALAYLKGARIGAKDGSQSKTEQTLWFLSELLKVYQERLLGVYGEKLSGYYLVQLLEITLKELTILWSGDTAHIVDGKFYGNVCDWECEFSEPDYPDSLDYAEDYYPEDFSRPYWIAIREKGFWFESPKSEKPLKSAQSVQLLQDINIRYYESGDVFANVPVDANGENLVIEVWGQSAEWLSCYARQGTKVLIDVLKSETVDDVRVLQAQINEAQLSQV